MGKRLYCGNLPYSATADEVKAIFSEGGRTVVDIHLVTDRETGRPRGFAFVELQTDEEAEEAIRALDGRLVGGRPLAVKEARERPPRGPGGGGPWRSGPPREHRRGGFGRGGAAGPPFDPYAPGHVPEDLGAPPRAMSFDEPAEYGPPDDVDYRDRSDRGRRGRDRRGGRRRQHDFDPGGW